MRIAFLFLLPVLLASAAYADVVHLKSGGSVEGTVEDAGDAWRVRHRAGTVTIKKADVLRIEVKRTFEDELTAKRAEVDAKDPDQLVALARWCIVLKRQKEADALYLEALEIDPDHRGARMALGYVFWEGAWRTEREIMEIKGLVLVDGKWMTPEEARGLEEQRDREKSVRDLQKFLIRRIRWLASRSAKTRKKAHDDIVTLAREVGDEGLVKFAGDAKAYYDRAWEIVASQKGVFEIRAQMTRLKRPIQTLQTTLGTGTPVKIQLPELSVASVGTTVVIPLGR